MSEDSICHDLDVATPHCESRDMIENLGDNPSEEALAKVAAVRAKECMNEMFGTDLRIVDREKLESIAVFTKDELQVGHYLGKGSFSDVFEVTATVVAEKDVTLAMKCLRPQLRSNAEQFLIGVEDLVHETAMLASLEHPNIIKLHGRAGASVSSCSDRSIPASFSLSDGYFILLDKLKDTLDDRVKLWEKSNLSNKSLPNITQVRTSMTLADALSYLHSKNICFRDLKPANVGFDSTGVLKLFDFGFAVEMDKPNAADGEEGLLYDKCGTPRYMAPEVGLEQGYALPSDVYSFGILLWEICALAKPFGKVKSATEFHKTVFTKGARPKITKSWPPVLKELMASCWSTVVSDRPEMPYVKSTLAAHVEDLTKNPQTQKKSGLLRRLTVS